MGVTGARAIVVSGEGVLKPIGSLTLDEVRHQEQKNWGATVSHPGGNNVAY